jgi:cyclic pyranopterin phosphate synthase
MTTHTPRFVPPLPIPVAREVRPDQLTDRYGRRHTSLRVSVTDRCNLKCSYCRPAALAYGENAGVLRDDEIVALVRAFAERGVGKLRLTGGEPLLRPGLPALARRLRELPGIEFVGITSNGVLLDRYLDELLDAGVAGVNLSLDTFERERFTAMCGVDAVDDVLRSLDGVLARPFAARKLNAVIQRGVNDDEVVRFASLAREHALDVRLLEFLPFAGNGWTPERWIPAPEMIERIQNALDVALVELPADGGVARMYRVDGFRGRIGFITGISHKFCDSCTRLRLTARGELRPCLYLDRGVDLREPLRAGHLAGELESRIAAALSMKPFENALNPHHAPIGVPVMTTLGG